MGDAKGMEPIGRVTHYFPKIGVAVVKVLRTIRTGDRVTVRGATTDFTQVVESMEVDHVPLREAKAGSEVGMKVAERVREGDELFPA